MGSFEVTGGVDRACSRFVFKPDKYKTRDKRDAEVFGVMSEPNDRKYSLIGQYFRCGQWHPGQWTTRGRWLHGGEDGLDLMPPNQKRLLFVRNATCWCRDLGIATIWPENAALELIERGDGLIVEARLVFGGEQDNVTQ